MGCKSGGAQMKRFVGYVLAIGGGLFMAWVAVAGGGFTAIFGAGCVATGFSEGCKDMALLAGLTVGGLLVGWLVYKAGRALIGQRRT